MVTIEDIDNKLDAVPEGAVLQHVWMEKIGEPLGDMQKFKLTLYFEKNGAKISVPISYKKPVSPPATEKTKLDKYAQKAEKPNFRGLFS